ncbi:MAG: DUF3426 domain-containing protein [Ramlibacter sp.]
MSLITRCPACGTMFKVVPDQLRISEGWVRCGHCSEIFDAAAHLNAGPQVTAPPPLPDQLRPLARESGPSSEGFASSLNTEIEEGVALDAPDSEQIEAEAEALAEDPRDRPFELRRADDSELEPSRIEDADAELHDVSFVRAARRKAFWTRRSVRAALAAIALVLASLLALQVAVYDRDHLAASEPALAPWLGKLCRALGCRIGPPRQIDAVAIDNSSFNKLRGDAYRLNVTVKNQATTPVAMPALELTLTDSQDQPLVRRVLLPAEVAGAPAAIGAAGEWSGTVTLALNANGTTSRVAGYRLLAFYP